MNLNLIKILKIPFFCVGVLIAVWSALTGNNYLLSIGMIFITIGFLLSNFSPNGDSEVSDIKKFLGLTGNDYLPTEIPQKRLDSKETLLRKSYIHENIIPGNNAPPIQFLDDAIQFNSFPNSDPLVPMYILDSDYRILDWNDAFSLAFDRSMEGRRLLGVQEWVYLLDNYKAVLDQGIKDFSDVNKLPLVHKEEIVFTSDRYKKITGTKTAIRVPIDESQWIWWITIDPNFSNSFTRGTFYRDLLSYLKSGLIWSEYALTYDRVLTNTNIYPDLLNSMLGLSHHPFDSLNPDSVVLDLGAGTGNLTKKLAEGNPKRVIIALDNNQMMLNVLRSKCKEFLRENIDMPGIVARKQDITSLNGISRNFFDFILCNNVLYSLDEYSISECISEIYRVLKPNGTVRISGPKKNVDLDILFKRIEDDLIKKDKFNELSQDFIQVKNINYHYLGPMLRRYDSNDMEKMLAKAGFSNFQVVDQDIYEGQAWIISAQK